MGSCPTDKEIRYFTIKAESEQLLFYIMLLLTPTDVYIDI